MDFNKRKKTDGTNYHDVKYDALYVAISKKNWDECDRLLSNSNIEEARRLIQYKSGYGTSPLHQACWNKAPINIVEFICEKYPQQAMKQNDGGWSPLGIACWYVSENTIASLLVAAPLASTMTSNNGSLPLHFATNFRRSPSVIKRLLTIHPTAVHAVGGKYGRTPFDEFVAVWKDDLEDAYPNLDRLPQGSYHGDNIDGLTVMKETLLLLLMAYVHGTVDMSNISQEAWLPMHEALKISKIPLKFLLVLAQTMHMECASHDKEKHFPLHIVCAQPPIYKDYDAYYSVVSDTRRI